LLTTVPLVKLVTDAANVAVVADLDLLVHPETMDNPAKLELLVQMANLVNHQLLLVNNKLLHHANHAQLEHPVHLDLLDLLVMLDQMATLELLAAQLLLASQDQKDLQAHLDLMDNLVLPVNLVPLLKAKEFNLDHLDPLVMLDHLDHPDLPAVLEMMELPVIQELKDLPAPTATPDPTETQVLPVKLVLPVVLEKKVSAPNIAPSMVVSSSKTELAVNHLQSKTTKRCSIGSDAYYFFSSFNCNAHCHCCHALWLCKILDRTRWFYLFVILSCAKYLDIKNKKII